MTCWWSLLDVHAHLGLKLGGRRGAPHWWSRRGPACLDFLRTLRLPVADERQPTYRPSKHYLRAT
eukprot:4757839-Pyramimonas_sp.AAC.1